MIKFSNYNILIIDDEEQIRNLLSKNFKKLENVNVDTADNLEEARIKIYKKEYHLVLCDYYLKPGTALDVLELIKSLHAKTPVIVITGGSEDEKKKSLEAGATVFFSKPFDYLEVLYVVKNILALYEANENLESAENIILALSRAIDAKDSYTEGHSQRVALYDVKMYDLSGLDDDVERKALYVGCILHDIGKIAIPDDILKSKKHPLSKEEFEIIKTHPVKGYEICKDLYNLKDSLVIIRNHHEKLNGTGYPDGLTQDQIPLHVQMCAIADIYDALTSKRSYREEKSAKEALNIMKNENVAKGEISSWLFSLLEKIVWKEIEDAHTDKKDNN